MEKFPIGGRNLRHQQYFVRFCVKKKENQPKNEASWYFGSYCSLLVSAEHSNITHQWCTKQKRCSTSNITWNSKKKRKSNFNPENVFSVFLIQSVKLDSNSSFTNTSKNYSKTTLKLIPSNSASPWNKVPTINYWELLPLSKMILNILL